MTPEDIDRWVMSIDHNAIAEASVALTEPERRKLSKHTQSLIGRLNRVRNTSDLTKAFKLRREMNQAYAAYGEGLFTSDALELRLNAAGLVALAVCPWSTIRTFPLAEDRPAWFGPAALRILDARRPVWATDWLTEAFEAEWSGVDWNLVLKFFKNGICQIPTSDAYIQDFASRIDQGWERSHTSNRLDPAEFLINNLDAMEFEIWRMFEVETMAFTWRTGLNWPDILIKFQSEGRLDRQRLLDASIEGASTLQTDEICSALAKFHCQLDPTVDELATREGQYLNLLISNTPSVVKLGLDMLRAINKANRLDTSSAASGLASAFSCKTKAPAKSAISLAKAIGKKDPGSKPEAALSLTLALRHPAEDVQAAAMTVLESWQDALSQEVRERIKADFDLLPPTLKTRARSLLGAEHRPESDSMEAERVNAGAIQDLIHRAKRLQEPFNERLGVKQAIHAIETGHVPKPCRWHIADVQVSQVADAILPIESFEELIDAVAHQIEVVDSPMEIERVFDGMCRLLREKPEDFQQRVAPLMRRTKHFQGESGDFNHAPSRSVYSADIVSEVFWTWLQYEPQSSRKFWHQVPIRHLMRRSEEIKKWINAGVSRPVLATPTHTGGWLKPTVFVQRLSQLQERALEVGTADLIQALLRLTPDGRIDALDMSAGLTGEIGTAVRWALGGDRPILSNLTSANSDLWLAAGRSRDPFGTLVDLAPIADHLAGPDGLHPASYDFAATMRHRRAAGYASGEYPHVAVEIDPKPVEISAHPTIDQHYHGPHDPHMSSVRWLTEWICMTWPMNPQSILPWGIDHMMLRLNKKASAWEPNVAYLVSLLERDQPWSPMAQVALWIGLQGVDDEVRSLCLDAMIEGIEDGRADPEALGQTLAKLSEGQWLKLNRLATNLNEIIRVSPRHAWVISVCLDRLIAALDPIPRDLHHILTIFRECLVQLSIPASPQTQVVLKQISGSGKAAKLAKAIREHQPDEPTADFRRAQTAGVEAIIDRAERWSNGHQSSKD